MGLESRPSNNAYVYLSKYFIFPIEKNSMDFLLAVDSPSEFWIIIILLTTFIVILILNPACRLLLNQRISANMINTTAIVCMNSTKWRIPRIQSIKFM